MKFIRANDVIDYLVAAYREELEDNGDLIASEFEKSVNNVVSARYHDSLDKIIVDGNVAELDDVLSESAKVALGMEVKHGS